DGGSVSVNSEDITVNNVAPTASITGAPTDPITEGTLVTLTADAHDAGADDTLSYAWTVNKDGDPLTLPESVDTTSSVLAFTTPDNGDYVATCTVTDDDGASVIISTVAFTVDNADPTVAVSGPAT